MMADSGSRAPTTRRSPTRKRAAYRADVSVGLDDFFNGRDGRVTFYKQNLDAGYSAPGQATIKDTEQYGGTFQMPVTEPPEPGAPRAIRGSRTRGSRPGRMEMDVAYKLTEQWSVSTGVRNDLRKDRSPVVPLTQEQGERTDAVAQVELRLQGAAGAPTASSRTRSRQAAAARSNGRVGAGGSYRFSQNASGSTREVSDGDLGTGGKIGTNYLHYRATTVCT